MTRLFRWLKHGHPLPDGWKLADQVITHHSYYCVLIERIRPEGAE